MHFKTWFLLGLVFVAGAVALAPTISLIGLDALPGDFVINQGNLHMTVPVAYSLCASFSMGLLYLYFRR